MYLVEKQSYSRGAWRVLDEEGRQVWQSASYALRLPNGTYVDMPIGAPVCFDRKRDALAWVAHKTAGS
jgi:hypothetical protein